MMNRSEVITPTTDAALREAAAKYSAALIDIPCYVKGVDGFATAHLGLNVAPNKLSTLVLADDSSLTVKTKDEQYKSLLCVAVDLEVPNIDTACIVEPSMSTANGTIELVRPVVRPLTETEGQELTMDLYSLITNMPIDRLKTS